MALIAHLNKIKKSQNCNRPDIRIELSYIKARIAKIAYELKKEFSRACNKYWEDKAKLINYKNSDTFFPTVNHMFHHNPSEPIKQINVKTRNTECLTALAINTNDIPRSDDSYIITDASQILDVLGWHFEQVNAPKPDTNNTELNNKVNAYYEALVNEIKYHETNNITLTNFSDENPASEPNYSDPTFGSVFYTPYETFQIMKKIKNKTSSGIDNIPNIILKNLSPSASDKYTILFNNIINNCYYPPRWKIAKILPILKKGKDSRPPSSYRPISLLPNISKIFESHLNNSITDFCHRNKIIPNQQFGFRHLHSTTHAINNLISDSMSLLNKHFHVAAYLIDLEKAFDSVWLKGLFYILTTYKFPAYLIRLLHNMLQNRSFITVSHSAKSSRTFKIEEGLQQGTVNSPLLFNIFNSKVLNEFGLNTNNNARSIAFADDLLIYLGGKYPDDSAQKLEKIVNKINTYYLDWHLKINASKCETILIRLPTKNLSRKKLNNWKNFEIKIHNTNESTPVPNKRQVKYLGVHIDDLLRLSSHPLIQLKKARTAFHANCKLFYNRHLQPKAKIICYALLVRPIITYACPLWFNQSASTMEKIRAFERACLRTCLNKYRSASSNYKHFIKNRVIYEEARLPRIDNFIIKLTRDYHAQCKNITSNPLIHGITNVDNGYLISCKHSGYIPPEGFTLLDKQGFIQNEHNTPTIYHWKRHKNNKKITFSLSNAPSLKYSTALPTTDINNSDRLNTTKYWWLTADSKFLEEIRRRMRRKKNTYNKEIIPMCNSIKFKQAVSHLILKRIL